MESGLNQRDEAAQYASVTQVPALKRHKKTSTRGVENQAVHFIFFKAGRSFIMAEARTRTHHHHQIKQSQSAYERTRAGAGARVRVYSSLASCVVCEWLRGCCARAGPRACLIRATSSFLRSMGVTSSTQLVATWRCSSTATGTLRFMPIQRPFHAARIWIVSAAGSNTTSLTSVRLSAPTRPPF